jgi:hypothetical protein
LGRAIAGRRRAPAQTAADKTVERARKRNPRFCVGSGDASETVVSVVSAVPFGFPVGGSESLKYYDGEE